MLIVTTTEGDLQHRLITFHPRCLVFISRHFVIRIKVSRHKQLRPEAPSLQPPFFDPDIYESSLIHLPAYFPLWKLQFVIEIDFVLVQHVILYMATRVL